MDYTIPMRLVDWARKQGIRYETAWRWFKAGKLPVPAIKTPTGMILVQIDEEQKPVGNGNWIYCRVSSHAKKDDLARQVERCEAFCSSRGWVIDGVVSEVASGMNDSRQKLMRLIDKKPARIIVEHKDRLTRFGFNYLETLLPKLGCEIVVMNRTDGKDDLMQDLVAVVTSFCCRLYGKRRGTRRAAAAEVSLRA